MAKNIETGRPPKLQPRERTAKQINKSVSTVKRYERAGILTPIRFVPGGRVHHRVDQVAALIGDE